MPALVLGARVQRVDVQRTERPAELLVLLAGEFLVAEDQYLPVQPGLPDLVLLGLRERPGQVDSLDLRADMRGQRSDPDGGCGGRHVGARLESGLYGHDAGHPVIRSAVH